MTSPRSTSRSPATRACWRSSCTCRARSCRTTTGADVRRAVRRDRRGRTPAGSGSGRPRATWTRRPTRSDRWSRISAPRAWRSRSTDDIDSPPEHTRLAVAQVPGGQVVEIPDATHLGPFDHPHPAPSSPHHLPPRSSAFVPQVDSRPVTATNARRVSTISASEVCEVRRRTVQPSSCSMRSRRRSASNALRLRCVSQPSYSIATFCSGYAKSSRNRSPPNAHPVLLHRRREPAVAQRPGACGSPAGSRHSIAPDAALGEQQSSSFDGCRPGACPSAASDRSTDHSVTSSTYESGVERPGDLPERHPAGAVDQRPRRTTSPGSRRRPDVVVRAADAGRCTRTPRSSGCDPAERVTSSALAIDVGEPVQRRRAEVRRDRSGSSREHRRKQASAPRSPARRATANTPWRTVRHSPVRTRRRI